MTVEQLPVYVASPLGFSPAGLLYWRETLRPALDEVGLEPLDPWELSHGRFAEIEAILDPRVRAEAYRRVNRDVGEANAVLIQNSLGLLAVLDGPDVDSGTAAEVGYAAALGLAIVGLRTDTRRSGDNEGAVVNLQLEYFITCGGGEIYRDHHRAAEALAGLVMDSIDTRK